MAYLIILGSIFLGAIVFMFSFIASKKNGKYYLAPIITFLFSGIIVAYSLFFVGGFEGMGYGFVGAGFLIASIAGTLLLPWLTRRNGAQTWKKRDKVSLIILPIIFFATIGLVIYSDDGYWIIDKGEIAYVEDAQEWENFYRTSTISEGRKMVYLLLGEDYLGKEIEVENVSRRGPTEVTVKITDSTEEDKRPYIKIGLDEIIEPLKVQTTDGVIFESAMDKVTD